jgi:hypothetical protein
MNPDPNAQQNPTVVLSADAKPFERALDNSLRKYQEWSGKLEGRADVAATNFRAKLEEVGKTTANAFSGGAAGEFFAALKEGGKSAAIFLGVQKAIEKTIEIAKTFNPILREWNLDMTKFKGEAAASAMFLERIGKDFARSRSELGGRDKGGAAEAKLLNDEIKALQRESANLQAKQEEAMAKAREVGEGFGRNLWNELSGVDATKQLEEANARAEEFGTLWRQAQDRLFEARRELQYINDPAKSAMRNKNIKDMVFDLEKQALVLGKSAEEARVFQMALEGYNVEQIERVRKAMQGLADAEREQEISELTKELAKQAETYGKTANEVKLYDLAQKGYTEAQLDRIRQEMQASEAAIAQKEKELEFFKQVEEYKAEQLKIGESGLVGAATGGSSAAANAIAAARADTARFANATPEQKAEMTRQQQLREQVKATAELQKLVGQVATLVSGVEGLSAF